MRIILIYKVKKGREQIRLVACGLLSLRFPRPLFLGNNYKKYFYKKERALNSRVKNARSHLMPNDIKTNIAGLEL
jgi:hypothetical protein